MMRTSNKYIRPYKVEIYGLQDNFIGTLQSYNDSFIGRIQEPILEISTDGTQKFTCSIPKYYIDKTTGQKLPNPRWEDTENGILAENTRVLKVFVKYPNETKVYPLIIDNLTTKRNDHFAVYKEITAKGLAFAELGKLGYKLELTHTTLEADYKENSKTVATINYWLDKVFPNERDANGKVIKWLTPWCYEIRMEWESLTGEILASDKIYDFPCVNSWGLSDDGKVLSPQSVSDYIEKARYIDCQYSNKYNITQTIAETYEVFCTYEYKCAENGAFIRNYTDENGNYWTGRKVVFYNRAIDMENPLVVNYQKNLNTISRTVDSSEIYTKMYVKPIESTVVPSGLISIADTSLNPILDDFILNFDYLRSIGNITDEQAQFIDDYQVELHKINTSLKVLGEEIADYTVLKNEEEAKVSSYEKELKAAQETLKKYEVLRNNGDMGSVTISATEGIPIGIYFYEKDGYYIAALTQEGINASTIQGYKSQTINSDNLIFDKVYDYATNIDINSIQNQAKVYVTYNEEGYPNSLITSLHNPNLAKIRSVWLTMIYTPGNYYNDICKIYSNLISNYTSKRNAAKSMLEKYKVLYDEVEKKETDLLTSKDLLNQKLENRLGPALREGYWSPTSYEDPGESREENLKITNSFQESESASMFFDTELLETEEKGWYQKGIEEEAAGIKHYYDYVNISSVYKAWSATTVNLDDLTIHLLQTRTYPFPNTFNDTSKTYYVYLYYNNIPYYFKLQGKASTENYELKLSEEISGLVLKLVTISSKKEETIPWLSERDADKALMTAFNNTGLTAGTYLYKDSGFVFSYLKSGSAFIPIIIFNDKEIYESALYNSYLTGLAYSFTNSNNMESLPKKVALTSKSVLGYPRIKIHNTGVMYESDALEIIPYLPSDEDGAYSDGVFSPLTKYEDYIITTNKGEPVFTLKPTGAQTLEKILDWPYHIKYKISRANELLYMDAIDVAYDSSRPRYSYELSVANLPQNVNNIRLGQLVQINDYSVGLRCETGYINTIKFNLDSPQDDNLTIQDYTTKFEDLFASITATNEAMKQNQNLYNTVAGSFAPNGAISGSVLQTALYNNELAFNYSHTRVEISPTEGIILTNLTPYDNGVYGQVVLKGGGVFLSSSLDAHGNRIWSEAITPFGLNASLLTAGAIDTSLIRIYSGDNLSFQWNGDGIFAYKRDEEGRPTMDAYVKYSDQGLQFIMEEPNNKDNCSVYLGWEGLKLTAQSGALALTAQDGLQIFYPEENDKNQLALQVGRWQKNNVGDGENIIDYYGMRLFDKTGEETFTVDNYGNLMITGTMQSKRFASGILGYGWQIRNDGTAEFQDVHVRGTISASVFEYKETTAVGGELYIGPTLIVDYNRAKEAKFTYANNQLTLEADLGFTGSGNTKLCGRTWAINDVLGINCCLTNDAGEKYEIKNLRMRLTTINNIVGKPDKLVSSTLWDTSLNVFYDENGNPIQLKNIDWKGLKPSGPINCIFIGSESETAHNRKGILLTAMADNSPYMDIYDDAESKIMGTPKVRIGNLNGLGELTWDNNTMTPKGYGLYSDNVYLTGAIYATKGSIGSLSIDEVEQTADVVNTITIKDATGKVIINKGSLTADSISAGLITGTHIATQTITTNNLSSEVGKSLNLQSNESINLIVTNIEKDYNSKLEVTNNRITSEVNEINKDISDTKTTITQTATEIRAEVTKEVEGLNSTIAQTATDIRTEIENEVEGLNSTITQTATSIKSEIKNEVDGLNSTITQTATDIRAEIADEVEGLNSTITQTATDIRAEVQNEVKGLNSTITQTASGIRTEVNDKVAELNSTITQTATDIRAEIKNEVEGLNSTITQTATDIRTEVNDEVEGLNSTITQTATNIRTEIKNEVEGLNSTITQTANSITLGVTDGTIPAGKVNTSKVNIDSTGINITTGGTFTVSSGNFSIFDNGTVEVKGIIKATGGEIGGWTIGANSLYAGSGTNRVALSTGNPTYAMWAGNETAENAPFRVTKDGKVYLTRVMALANEGDTTPTEVNLSSVSFWKLDRAVKTLEVNGNTLTIALYNGTTVNFKKAATGVLIGSGSGSADNFTVSYVEDYTGPGTGTVVKSGNVKMKLNSKTYSALSSVIASFDGTDYATLPVGDVYTQGKTDGANNVKNNIILSSKGWQTGGRNIVESNYGQSYTVELPPFSTSGGTSFTDNKTTVYFSTSSVSGPLKSVEVDASSVYTSGYNAGNGVGYNTGYAAGKDSYKPTSIVRTGYNTTDKTVTVKTANSHQDLLTNVSINASEIYDAGYTSGNGAGYNTGYADGKDSYRPTSIVRTGYDTAYKTVTVKAANSHQDLLTGVSIDASEIYDAGTGAGYNTGYAAAKDAYNPTSIVRTGYSTTYKTITVKTANSHQDLLTDVSIDASEIYDAGYTSGNGDGYNTGYAAGKDAYQPTAINRTSYDTDAKTVTVRALNSHQDLLTGQVISASEIYDAGYQAAKDAYYNSRYQDGYDDGVMAGYDNGYEAGRAAGRAEMGIIRDGNTVTVGVSDTKTMRAYLHDTHYVIKGSQINLTPGKLFTGTAGAYYYGNDIALGGSAAVWWE